jgi:hypothetical protein
MPKKISQPDLKAFHKDRARLVEIGLAYGVCLRTTGRKPEKRAAEASRLRSSLEDLLERLPPPPDPSSVLFSMLPPGGWPPYPDPSEMIPELDPSRFIPPRGRRSFIVQTCRESQDIIATDAAYTEFSRSGSTECSSVAPKSVSMRVSAGQSTPGQPPVSAAICGYRSIVEFTTAHSGSIIVRSASNASISWIEANTYPWIELATGKTGGGGGSASAVVRCGMSALLGGTITSPAEAILATYEAAGPEQVSYAVGLARTADLNVRISIPSAGSYRVTVDEWISMTAAAADAHAYISGAATWNPVEVEVRCDCRSMRVETLPAFFGDFAR